jgi:hypothetical protein
MNQFGNRCPQTYQKVDFLGIGRNSIVWQAKKASGETVVLKQYPMNQQDSMDL